MEELHRRLNLIAVGLAAQAVADAALLFAVGQWFGWWRQIWGMIEGIVR